MRRTYPFADDVAEDGTLEIDEGVVERSVSLDPPFVPSLDIAEREGADCVQRALELLGGEVNCGSEPVLGADDDHEDSIVDVVGGEQRDEGAESESFTFADVLMRANLLSETVLEGDVRTAIVLVFIFHSRYLSFRNIIVAIHIFLKLVISARLNMKGALVF